MRSPSEIERLERQLLGRVARNCPTDFTAEQIEEVRDKFAQFMTWKPNMQPIDQKFIIGAIADEVQRAALRTSQL